MCFDDLVNRGQTSISGGSLDKSWSDRYCYPEDASKDC